MHKIIQSSCQTFEILSFLYYILHEYATKIEGSYLKNIFSFANIKCQANNINMGFDSLTFANTRYTMMFVMIISY